MAFPMEHQKETNWCWDAVAVSVQHYFDPNTELTQTEFAKQVLGVPLPQADQPWYLWKALQKLGKLNGNPLPGALGFEAIKQQLDADLPVCVQIAWDEGGTSHYVVISGYGKSPGGDWQVQVSDPFLQDSNVTTVDYESFKYAYGPSYANAEGYWLDSCLVKA